MNRVADPSSYRLTVIMSDLGLGTGITDKNRSKAVRKYLCECRSSRDKVKVLMPVCLDIARQEIESGYFDGDICLKEYVARMMTGAHVSQLESFYIRYRSSRNKTAFFMNFVLNEL